MKVQDALTDSTIASIGSKATYTGAASAVFGGLAANDIAAIGGLAVAIVGLVINVIYRHREYRLKRDFYRRAEFGSNEP